MKKIIFLIALSIISATPSFADPKVWETNERIDKDLGDIYIQMQTSNERNNPTKFWLYVSKKSTKVDVIFRGVCAELLTVTANVNDHRLVDLNRFLETRSGKDLPVAELLNQTQKTLSEQCDQQPQVMRVKVTSIWDPINGKNLTYHGTMTKANGWELQDGKIKTAFDHTRKFELGFKGSRSISIQYKGTCDDNPTLPLAPSYASYYEKGMAKTPDMDSYQKFGSYVNQKYLKECPETKTIKYTLDPVPEDYLCPPKEECYLTAAKDSNWKAKPIGFARSKEEVAPIYDFNGMTDTLAAGNFDIIPEYKDFYAFYFESFIQLYSDHCRTHIKVPVGRSIQTIERIIGQFGPVSEKPVGPPREIFIEKKYFSLFGTYYQSWKPWATRRFMQSAMKAQSRGGGNPGGAMSGAMRFFSSNYSQLENIIQGNCTNERVQIVYENLYRYGYTGIQLTPSQKAQRASVLQYYKDIGIILPKNAEDPIPARQEPLRLTTPQTKSTESKAPAKASTNKKKTSATKKVEPTVKAANLEKEKQAKLLQQQKQQAEKKMLEELAIKQKQAIEQAQKQAAINAKLLEERNAQARKEAEEEAAKAETRRLERQKIQAEKQKAMQQELAVLSQEINKHQQEMVQGFKARLKKAATGEEQNKIRAELVVAMKAYGEKYQKALAEISERYK